MSIIKKGISFILKKIKKLDKYIIDDENIDNGKSKEISKDQTNNKIKEQNQESKINYKNNDNIIKENNSENYKEPEIEKYNVDKKAIDDYLDLKNSYLKDTLSSNYNNNQRNEKPVLRKLDTFREKKKDNINFNIDLKETKIDSNKNNLNEINSDKINFNQNKNNSYNEINENKIYEQKQQNNSQTLTNIYEEVENKPPISRIYETEKIDFNKLNTIWDVIKIKENTQAEHIIKSLSAEHWMNMDELKKTIKLKFNVEYQNEKSLYPYIKTLSDVNLIKINNTGKKRSWKKNVIIIEEKNK